MFYPDTQKAAVTLLKDKWRRPKQLSLEEFPDMIYFAFSGSNLEEQELDSCYYHSKEGIEKGTGSKSV